MNTPPATLQRPFRDAGDFDAMRALLSAGNLARNGTLYPQPGDLNWWTHNPPDPERWRKQFMLWEARGRLIAWAMTTNDDGESSLDYYTHPDIVDTPTQQTCFAAATGWATQVAAASGSHALSLYWVAENDARMHALAAASALTESEPSFIHFWRDLGRAIPDSPLPEGYRITDARDDAGFLTRLQALHSAFGAHREWNAYLQKAQAFRASDVFVPAHNLAIAAPDGHGAAGCTIWLDPVSKVGLFEPVGTHTGYQRRGLGKSLLYEGLRRLRAAGMRTASVMTHHDSAPAHALYQSVGFQIATRTVALRRTLDPQ
jgi:mycothiol synthase